jgi:site-specific recombinase XerD
MNKFFAVLFHVKKSKVTANGTSPIFMRVTIDGGRIEISTKRLVEPHKWNMAGQKAIGSTEAVRSLNAYLKTLEQQVYDVHKRMIENHEPLTASRLKTILLGGDKPQNVTTLIPVFKEHNRRIGALIGKDYAKGTFDRYETSLKHTQEFLLWRYKTTDIELNKIDNEFITSYDFYLRSQRNCNNNSTVKYLKNFKKIILICIANGWIEKDPFAKYKNKVKEVKREYLNNAELEILAAKPLVSERVCQVRDIFLFSCYTGLAYADVKKLKRSEIVLGLDNEQWIFTSRQKTDTDSRIPLLPPALSLIERYEGHPQCSNSGLLFPVLSNQKMNCYLKEIADVCGISKTLTYHIARHTFATTVTLSNGVSIESVSKMLGHKNMRTTQHYAKILDKKVSDDMNKLRRSWNEKKEISFNSET